MISLTKCLSGKNARSLIGSDRYWTFASSASRFYHASTVIHATNKLLSNSAQKKANIKIDKLFDFYLTNELPDKTLEAQLQPIKNSLRIQRGLVDRLKSQQAPSDQIQKALSQYLEEKSFFNKKLLDANIELPNESEKSEAKSADALDSPEVQRKLLEDLVKRHFIYGPAFDIYGGASGLYDLGPIGCSMQNNMLRLWRQLFVKHDRMLEVDCPSLTPGTVFKASGHLSKFSDAQVRDALTNEPYRADHLLKAELKARLDAIATTETLDNDKDVLRSLLARLESGEITSLDEIDAIIERFHIKAPNTGNALHKAHQFNLMFQIQTQNAPGDESQAHNKYYQRPETAQGIFANFRRLYKSNGAQLPMAVAQVGKAFRNEISPRGGILRQREFLMAEIEHFVDGRDKCAPYKPFASVQHIELDLLAAATQDAQAKQRSATTVASSTMTLRNAVDSGVIMSETVAYYIGRIYQFVIRCGIDPKRVRFRQHTRNEMAHYAVDCWDLECHTTHGWLECAGIADRGDHDLRQHSIHSRHVLSSNKGDKSKEVVRDLLRARTSFFANLNEKASNLFVEHVVDDLDTLRTQIEKERSSETKTKHITIKNKSVVQLTDTQLAELDELVHNELFQHIRYPHVIEPSFGISRLLYTVLEHSLKPHNSSNSSNSQQYLFAFTYEMAPFKCKVLSVVNKPEKFQPALDEICNLLGEHGIDYQLDVTSNSMGKAYARADEIGIPYAVTVDDTTLTHQRVRIRERSSAQQLTVEVKHVAKIIDALGSGKMTWSDLQKHCIV